MGHPAKHDHGGHGGHGGHGEHGHSGPMFGGGSMPPLFIPAPMAIFGTIVAFMFGFTVGSMMGRTQMMMRQSMMTGGGMGGSHKPWKGHGRGMGASHHHHGPGAPACKKQHGHWPGDVLAEK